MADFSKEFLERTIKVWQPRYDRFRTLEDAREIAENMTRLFKLLGTERKSSPKPKLWPLADRDDPV
jgi:hypothetical protein